jgi:hypothetical protein
MASRRLSREIFMRQIWIVCGAILAGVTAGLGGFAAYLGLRADAVPSEPRLDAEIGTVRLHLDPALARFEEQRRGGRQERLDLALLLPDFRAAGTLRERGQSAEELAEKMVFLSVSAADGTLDPADRFVQLYARFLTPEQAAGPAGLIKRRFEPASPFANEDLFIAAPEGRQFAARCRAAEAGLPDMCVYEFWRGGVAVQLRFSPRALADWPNLKARSEALITNAAR